VQIGHATSRIRLPETSDDLVPEDDLLFISMASCWKQQIILSQHVQIWKVRYVSTGIHHWQTSGWCRNSTCHLQWYNRLKVFSVKLVWSILTFQFIYIRPSPTAPLSHLLSVKIEKERQNPPSNSSSIRTASVSRFALNKSKMVGSRNKVKYYPLKVN